MPPGDMARVYPLVEWHFDSFAERSNGATLSTDLLTEVETEKKQCWIAWDDGVRACALTQVLTGRVKVVEVTHCAGKGREDWQGPIMEEIMNWARHIGATQLMTINRPGYTKFLKGLGLKETHRIMEMAL